MSKQKNTFRIILGVIFALSFIITVWAQLKGVLKTNTLFVQLISIAEIFLSLLCVLPQKKYEKKEDLPSNYIKPNRRNLFLTNILVLLAIPLTIILGVYLLDDKRYYFISLLIVIEILIPVFVLFEKKKPQAREVVVISVLCAITVGGRVAFSMLPQFKPAIALIIIAGVCFGGEIGFLVGAVSGFVSNMFFGQGPWTPWQMFAFGVIGFVAGALFGKGYLRKTKGVLSIFGFVSTLLLYGGILNPASVIMWQPKPTAEMIISSYVMGLPFDLVHALSSAFFLWFISDEMMDKLDRIKIKYGMF